jgi:hypothetical protein
MDVPVKAFPQNIYVERLTEMGRLQSLATKLWPVISEVDMVRVGSDGDGGYLLPNDFSGIDVCFSPGVELNSSFEASLFEITGFQSHLADFSVDGPPPGFKPKSFIKKFLGPICSNEFITLEKWVSDQEEYHNSGDFILQYDIEGGEYLTLLAAPNFILSRFRIIVLEIHNIEIWASPSFFGIVEAFFEKILETFWVVHNHPNNHGLILDLGGFIAPQVFEITLLRKDRSKAVGFRQDFPHQFDRPCLDRSPELNLPKNWYAAHPS